MIDVALSLLILVAQPHSCRELERVVRRCQFDGCDVIRMERLQRQCAADSANQK